MISLTMLYAYSVTHDGLSYVPLKLACGSFAVVSQDQT